MEKNNAFGVYLIFKSMELGRTFRISLPKFPTQDPNYRILAHQRSRFTHYYFYVRDEVLGPIIVRVASFFPFHATYWLNGHSFIERELTKAGIGFHKNDNAFLAVDDVAALQAAADRLSPAVIRKQLDYWTLILGPKFSKKERGQMNLSCAHCHDANWGKRLLSETISQGHPNAYPTYRMEWQTMGSLQRRIRACLSGIRAEMLPYGSQEYLDLELFLAWRAQGLPIETPGVRR